MKGKGLISIILTTVLGIGVGVGGTLGVQKFLLSKTTPTPTQVVAVDGPVVEVGEFTINLQGGAFLKTLIAVEGTDKKSETQIKAKDAFIKDRINTVLTSKSLADMQPANRDKLKKELITQLNEVTGNKIQNVLFLSFVYQ